jgi:hypothetical protein
MFDCVFFDERSFASFFSQKVTLGFHDFIAHRQRIMSVNPELLTTALRASMLTGWVGTPLRIDRPNESSYQSKASQSKSTVTLSGLDLITIMVYAVCLDSLDALSTVCLDNLDALSTVKCHHTQP